MNAFISHNHADRVVSRLLAIALVQQGINVWFDEWNIRPGDSLVGGIETGLGQASIFVLVWSADAEKSKWVGTELRAYVTRRIGDASLRIVPVWTDETPLPLLVADCKGFRLSDAPSLDDIAVRISGRQPDREIAKVLQERLLALVDGSYSGHDPLPFLVCPTCGSAALARGEAFSDRGDRYATIGCESCGWSDGSEV